MSQIDGCGGFELTVDIVGDCARLHIVFPCSKIELDCASFGNACELGKKD